MSTSPVFLVREIRANPALPIEATLTTSRLDSQWLYPESYIGLQLADKSPSWPVSVQLFAARNAAIFSFRNLPSAGLLAAPAVCPQRDGIGTKETLDMNDISYRASPMGK